MTSTSRLALSCVVLTVSGCSAAHSEPLTRATADSRDGTSAVGFELSAAAYSTGSSVRICGERSKPADSSAHCASVLPAEASSVAVPGAAAGTSCPCFAFGEDGQLIDPKTGERASVHGLCPSSDTPTSDWKFTYTLYAGNECTGAAINGDDSNLTCYDSKDLLTQANPNASVEQLDVGNNANKVICLANTSTKEWQFLSCAVATTHKDEEQKQIRYECGCAPSDHDHTCCCGGLTEQDLEDGCHFDETTCDIVCSTVCEN